MTAQRPTRIPATLLVEVRGIDSEPRRRQADVSTGGIFFETPIDLAPPGSMHSLRILTEDRAHDVTLTARAVRRVATQDEWMGERVRGAAFRFIFEQEADRHALQGLLDALGGHSAVPSVAAHVPLDQPVRTSGVIVIEAPWELAPGETVNVVLDAPGSRRKHQAKATVAASAEIALSGGWHRVTLRLGAATPTVNEGPSPETVSISDALSVALEHVKTGATAGDDRLRGQVNVVPLTGLVSFLELQRMTGRLEVTRGGDVAAIYVAEGRVVDVEVGGGPAEPADVAVIEVLGWPEGTFAFERQPVDREDRVRRPTMELLLEAARLQDEESF